MNIIEIDAATEKPRREGFNSFAVTGMDWLSQALCAKDPNPDAWTGGSTRAERERAERTCMICPVLADCQKAATKTGNVSGMIWAGKVQ